LGDNLGDNSGGNLGNNLGDNLGDNWRDHLGDNVGDTLMVLGPPETSKEVPFVTPTRAARKKSPSLDWKNVNCVMETRNPRTRRKRIRPNLIHLFVSARCLKCSSPLDRASILLKHNNFCQSQ
jgi:hypothetical protein